MTEKTDWMWVYENPKDAAAEIDRLRSALEKIRDGHSEDPQLDAIRALGQTLRD